MTKIDIDEDNLSFLINHLLSELKYDIHDFDQYEAAIDEDKGNNTTNITKDIDYLAKRVASKNRLDKLRTFIKTFDELAGSDENEVQHDTLIRTLTDTNRFTEDEVEVHIKKVIEYGQIYEIRDGVYKRA